MLKAFYAVYLYFQILLQILLLISIWQFTIQDSQAQNIEGKWLPCLEISRDLRLPCQCMLQKSNSTAIHLNCDRVAFVGGDITLIPNGAPIVSLSQRWSGRQVLPTRVSYFLNYASAKS